LPPPLSERSIDPDFEEAVKRGEEAERERLAASASAAELKAARDRARAEAAEVAKRAADERAKAESPKLGDAAVSADPVGAGVP
jgi:hypothetical protein